MKHKQLCEEGKGEKQHTVQEKSEHGDLCDLIKGNVKDVEALKARHGPVAEAEGGIKDHEGELKDRIDYRAMQRVLVKVFEVL